MYVDTQIYVLYTHAYIYMYLPFFIYIYMHRLSPMYFTKGHNATKYTLLYFTKVIAPM